MTTKVTRNMLNTSIDDNGNATAITIDSSERVLIGTDSGDSFNSDSMLRLQRTGDRVFMQFKTDADQNSGILFGDVDDDVECSIEYEPANQALTFSTGNNNEALRIDSSQKVGIGCTPHFTFDVQLNSSRRIGFNYSDSQNTILSHDGSGNIETLGLRGNTLLFYTDYDSSNPDGVERMRIADTGNVSIGYTADTGNRFFVYGNSPGYIARLQHDGNDNDRYGMRIITGSDSATSGQYWMRFDDGDGHAQAYITHSSGTVLIDQASDERLKENIVDSTLEGINILKGIKQREFNWKRDANKEKVIGYIAQELETVYPAAVHTNTDVSGEGITAPEDDPDNPYKFFAKEKLIDVLIKAGQEQQTIIEDLKARIETLEAG